MSRYVILSGAKNLIAPRKRQILAYAAVSKDITMFVGLFCVILTMYGGGFATIPAYLADLFGAQFVGAIHGRLLTAWSTAAIVGPLMVNFIRDFQLDRGVPKDAAYNVTLYLLAILLFIGFVSNLLVRPVKESHFMSDEELRKERKRGHDKLGEDQAQEQKHLRLGAGSWIKVGVAWTMVGIPLLWGVMKTMEKAAGLFG